MQIIRLQAEEAVEEGEETESYSKLFYEKARLKSPAVNLRSRENNNYFPLKICGNFLKILVPRVTEVKEKNLVENL